MLFEAAMLHEEAEATSRVEDGLKLLPRLHLICVLECCMTCTGV